MGTAKVQFLDTVVRVQFLNTLFSSIFFFFNFKQRKQPDLGVSIQVPTVTAFSKMLDLFLVRNGVVYVFRGILSSGTE